MRTARGRTFLEWREPGDSEEKLQLREVVADAGLHVGTTVGLASGRSATVLPRVHGAVHGDSMTRPTITGRVALSVCAAGVALVAALVAAIGPAHGQSAEFAWPPARVPAAAPLLGWYAPLPLLNRVPSSIDVDVPCELAPPIDETRPSVTVVATARQPRSKQALQVVLKDGAMQVEIGARQLASVPWPESCPLFIAVRSGTLTLSGERFQLKTGTLDDMPIVTGLFSSLDLRKGRPPSVVLRTRDYATSWSAKQNVAAVLAAVLVCLALLLLCSRLPSRRSFEHLRRTAASGWRARDWSDGVVVCVLVVWWVVAPGFPDDGWLAVEHHLLDDIGAVNLYYDGWGLNVPLGYWLMWLVHWIVGSTSDLVFMRVPALLVLLASWPLCRWCVRSAVPTASGSVVRWTLAGSFLVGATAWGMTLRLEPFVSLLVLVTLASMISFSAMPSPGRLGIAMTAAAFAATAHPVGVVAAAPLIAGLPDVIRWLRAEAWPRVITVTTLVFAGTAVALILLALDADVATRFGDAAVFRQDAAHAEPWWREHIRYARFDQYGGDNAIRRMSLALIVLPVVGVLTRLRSVRTGFGLLPAHSVGIGLVLLAFVPSKWPWHFGSLAALGAVAATAEVARLLRERARTRAASARAAVGLLVLLMAGFWAWSALGEWGPLDLRVTSWRDGFNVYPWLVAVPAIALGAGLAQRRKRRRSLERSLDHPSVVAGWAVVVLSFAVIGVTISVLVVDAARAPWTTGRQNVETLLGRTNCGVVDELTGDTTLTQRMAAPNVRTLILPYISPYFPCSTTPGVDRGLLATPDLVVLQATTRWPVLQRDAPFTAVLDLYPVMEVARGPEGVEVYSVDTGLPGYGYLPPVRRER